MEIAENLHRADLTALERDEHIAEWIRLADLQSAQLAQIETKRADGRRKGPQHQEHPHGLCRRPKRERSSPVQAVDETHACERGEHGGHLRCDLAALLEARRQSRGVERAGGGGKGGHDGGGLGNVVRREGDLRGGRCFGLRAHRAANEFEFSLLLRRAEAWDLIFRPKPTDETARFFLGPLLVKSNKTREDVVVRNVGRPAIGVGDSGVEFVV